MNTLHRLDCRKLPPPPIYTASARDMTQPRSGTARHRTAPQGTARDERIPSISPANSNGDISAANPDGDLGMR